MADLIRKRETRTQGRTFLAASIFACLICCFRSHIEARGDTLSDRLQPLISAHPGLVSASVKHLGNGQEFHFEADRPMPTASLIKLPLMVSAYGKIARGELQLGQRIVLREDDKVPGSGILTDHFSAGTDLSLRDAIHLMIVFSDNTATNLVVDQVGLRHLNDDMEGLGLSQTRMNSKVYRRIDSVDPERSERFGLGSTTSREMVRLLELLERSELHGSDACAAMKEHLLVCDDKTKILRRLPEGVRAAHKSGEVSASRTEAGIIYSASGPIALAVLTSDNEDRSFDDDNAAHQLIGQIADEAYRHFNPHGEPIAAGKPMGNGAQGELVADLQRTLNARIDPSPSLSVDGEFGPATLAAVKTFQGNQGWETTGVVDAAFWERLGPLNSAESAIEQLVPRTPADPETGAPFVTAAAWAVLDGQSGKILASHECQSQREIASTTKIMTAWMVLRWAQRHPEVLRERVTVSPRASSTEGSSTRLRPGESLTVDELMYGLLLPSGNDAAVALAEHFGNRVSELTDCATVHGQPADQVDSAVSGGTTPDSESGRDRLHAFVKAMNSESQRLGLAGTNWTNTNGLPDTKNVSTAGDLGALSVQAMRIDTFRRYVGTRRFTCAVTGAGGYQRQVTWENTNQLLDTDGFGGIKTGTTDRAGSCLVGQATSGDRERVIVILGAASSESRYTDIRNLFRWSRSLNEEQ